MIKRNYNFIVDKTNDRHNGKLRFRVRWQGYKVDFSLGFKVDHDKWSRETQRCKNNTTHGTKKVAASIINKKINLYELLADEVFNSFEKENITPTAEQFKEAFKARIGQGKPEKGSGKNIFDYLEEFKIDIGFRNMWNPETYEKFDALEGNLKRFNPDLTFEHLTERGLTDFVRHLINVEGLRNSTALKKISLLKWFLKWGANKGYNKELAFTTFSPRLKTTEKAIIFLDWDELMTLYNFNFPENKSSLEKVRDVFCFCCFTSLRYSDVANLKRSCVFDNYISVTTIKTSDHVIIELNKYAKAILDKYKDKHNYKGLALPVISNQKMNVSIKEICRMCNINKPVNITYFKGNRRYDETYPKWMLIGTHSARRTFVCNALMLGISPQVVMKWTGHSNYKAMKPYIDITDKAKRSAMELFDKLSPAPGNGGPN